MKITVEHLGAKIEIEEVKGEHSTLRWPDQKFSIQETITLIVDEVIRLNKEA